MMSTFFRAPFLLSGLVLAFFSTAPAVSQTTPASSLEYVTGLGFGGALAVGDGEIFAGSAPVGWPRGAEPAGEVYAYVLSGDGTWTVAAVMTAPEASIGDDFGRTIALKGDLLVIGAPGLATAYVYERREDGRWSISGRLTPSVLHGEAEFGGAYARGGSRRQNIEIGDGFIAVTAYDASINSGAVHVFIHQGGAWHETAVLDVDGGDADRFAFAIASNGSNLLVGAPGENERAGAVYAYAVDASSGNAEQTARISLSEEDGAVGLGMSLDMHMNHAVVGAPGLAQRGGVVLFDGYNGWVEMSRSTAPDMDGVRIAGFGSSIAVSPTDVVVGSNTGTVFVAPFAAEPSFSLISAPDERRSPSFGTGLAIHGDVLAIGSPGADFEAGVASVFERSAASGRWMDAGILASDVSYLDAITGNEVSCEDGTAGVFGCDGVDLVAFLPISDVSTTRGAGMTDIWGWTDEETGKEWVLAGRTEGVAFVDISNPTNPVYVGELPKTATSPGSGWRDVKVYRDHAYVVSDGARHHGVQIFDLRQLRDVDVADMPVTFMQTNWYGGVASTHNFVINEESGFGYAVGNGSGGETCNGQLHMLDLRDPGNPVFAGCYSHPEAGGTHDSQCVNYHGPDADYEGSEICLNSNGSSFIIADVTDKSNPVTIARATYPLTAYTHQGWLTDDHRYFYMNDELDELNELVSGTRTLIWDVADLDDPLLVGEYTADNAASDHNLYVNGNFMYQANYQAGLRILDISDPLNPVSIGSFDTVPFGDNVPGFGGAWSVYPYFKSGVLPVTSRGEGLFLLRKQEQDL